MILFVIAGIAAVGAIVMWLWNWLIPDLFSGPVISFWQALGLMLLTRILFRGFRKPNGGHGKWGMWKSRYAKMSPEEREKMRELWKKRCGYGCDDEPEQEKAD